jgi:hypothetical protein
MKNKPLNTLILIIAVIFLAACKNSNSNINQPNNDQNSQTNDSEQSSNDQDEVSEVSAEDTLVIIESAYETSAHANTYILDSSGNNNDCAKCHSPINWMPSMDTLSESCLVCKFEIADPEPFIAEHDWDNIPCKTCHKLDKKDNVEPEIYWLEIAPIDQYASVESSTELCQKCHHPAEGLHNHPGTVVSGAHEGYQCDDCHDPHSNTSSCSTAECHSTFGMESEPVVGHDDDHQMVSCAACHDGSGLMVDKSDDSIWYTFILGENEEKHQFYSHDIVLESSCERCHYSDNPWDLSDNVSQP